MRAALLLLRKSLYFSPLRPATAIKTEALAPSVHYKMALVTAKYFLGFRISFRTRYYLIVFMVFAADIPAYV